MKILRIIFQGFNKDVGQFAECVLLIQEDFFTIPNVWRISNKYKFPVCSELKMDRLVESRCREAGEEFWEIYLDAVRNKYSFTSFPDSLNMAMNPFKLPRFSEIDFDNIITDLGGIKIPTSEIKTPDFLLNNIALELKDLQTEGLLNKDRQNSLGNIFKGVSSYTLNLDPTLYYEGLTEEYHRLIANTIQNHVKKASQQIKAFIEKNKVESAGIIILNTGLCSVPHNLLKSIMQDILYRRTNTIRFAFIFSQTMQTNGFDSYAIFCSEFIGDTPDSIKPIKESVYNLVGKKMTRLICQNDISITIDSQHPISFLSGDKIFYWNPGKVKDSRMNNINTK